MPAMPWRTIVWSSAKSTLSGAPVSGVSLNAGIPSLRRREGQYNLPLGAPRLHIQRSAWKDDSEKSNFRFTAF